jgi:ribonuclease Z
MSDRIISRRDALRASAALGGLALGGGLLAPPAVAASRGLRSAALTCEGSCYPPTDESERQKYTHFQEHLEPLDYFVTDATGFRSALYPPLDPDEMRITFMGSNIPPVRRAQQMMSIFVEVGWNEAEHRALDSFVFDCGSGVCANYGAMDVGYARMDKVFISHLHGDHMSDLTHIYCFGPSADRVTPQYVFGPGPSGIKSPRPPRRYYDDGTRAFCQNLREAMRWHTESFGFQNTRLKSYPSQEDIRYAWGLPVVPRQVSDDPWGDGYAMVPVELDWRKEGGVAYENSTTGVRVTHFPVIHARQGSIGYLLEWNGLSMIYTSDTKPEKVSVRQACNGGKGVDVFIHEMGVAPDIWAMQAQHLRVPPPLNSPAVQRLMMVQNSSHTPQGAFGFLLSQIDPKPRLTVATHFPTSDDTVYCAMNSLAQYVDPTWLGDIGDKVTWSFDRMVIRLHVASDAIEQRRAEVLDFGSSPIVRLEASSLATPKYADAQGVGDPYAQIDKREAYEPGPDTYCDTGY